MTACPSLILQPARDSQAERSGQQPWGQVLQGCCAHRCYPEEKDSLPPCRLKLTSANKVFSQVPFGNTGTALPHEPENWSWAKFLSQALRREDHLRLACSHLQQNLASDVSRVTASLLQFALLFFQTRKQVPPARRMCSPSSECLSSSARFLPDTSVRACPRHFLSGLVSVQAFGRDRCTCLPGQPFDGRLPVPAHISTALLKHEHRADSRSHLAAYACPSPICISSSGVLVCVKRSEHFLFWL